MLPLNVILPIQIVRPGCRARCAASVRELSGCGSVVQPFKGPLLRDDFRLRRTPFGYLSSLLLQLPRRHGDCFGAVPFVRACRVRREECSGLGSERSPWRARADSPAASPGLRSERHLRALMVRPLPFAKGSLRTRAALSEGTLLQFSRCRLFQLPNLDPAHEARV